MKNDKDKTNKSITQQDYLQLVGLLAIAKQQCKMLKLIEESAASLLSEESDDGYYGHVSDFIYSPENRDAKELCKLLDIKVNKK